MLFLEHFFLVFSKTYSSSDIRYYSPKLAGIAGNSFGGIDNREGFVLLIFYAD